MWCENLLWKKKLILGQSLNLALCVLARVRQSLVYFHKDLNSSFIHGYFWEEVSGFVDRDACCVENFVHRNVWNEKISFFRCQNCWMGMEKENNFVRCEIWRVIERVYFLVSGTGFPYILETWKCFDWSLRTGVVWNIGIMKYQNCSEISCMKYHNHNAVSVRKVQKFVVEWTNDFLFDFYVGNFTDVQHDTKILRK